MSWRAVFGVLTLTPRYLLNSSQCTPHPCPTAYVWWAATFVCETAHPSPPSRATPRVSWTWLGLVCVGGVLCLLFYPSPFSAVSSYVLLMRNLYRSTNPMDVQTLLLLFRSLLYETPCNRVFVHRVPRVVLGALQHALVLVCSRSLAQSMGSCCPDHGTALHVCGTRPPAPAHRCWRVMRTACAWWGYQMATLRRCVCACAGCTKYCVVFCSSTCLLGGCNSAPVCYVLAHG